MPGHHGLAYCSKKTSPCGSYVTLDLERVWLVLQTYMNPVQEQQPNYMAARIEVPPLFPPPQRHQSAKNIVARLDSDVDDGPFPHPAED